MKTRSTLCVAAAAALGAGGCARMNNDRLVGMDPGVPMAPAGERSVLGLGRDNWERREFVVEADVLEHGPTYTALRPMSADASPMQSGAEPTSEDSFEWDDDRGAQMADGVAAPFVAGWEVLTMPVAMIMQWPGSVRADGPAWFDRYHQPVDSFEADDPAPDAPAQGTADEP